MGLFDGAEDYAISKIQNNVNNFALGSLNSVFDNVPFLGELGFSVSDGSIFDTSKDPINDLEKYSGELSTKNRFDFIFLLPNMLRKEEANVSDILRVFCRQFPIPSTSTNISKQKILNRTVSGVNSMDFDTINATFFDTKKLTLHKLFNIWHMNKWNKNGTLQFYPDDYKTDVMVLNHNNKVYLIKGLHPATVGDVVLNHDSTDELLTFDVTFNVDSIEVYGDLGVGVAQSPIINTGIGLVDDIGNFALSTAQNYFNNQVNQTVKNATSSLTSKLRF